MPLQIESIFSNTTEKLNYYPRSGATDYWIMVSGVTPGSRINGYFRQGIISNQVNYNTATVPYGFAIGSSVSRALLCLEGGDVFNLTDTDIATTVEPLNTTSTIGLVVKDVISGETTVVSGPLVVATVPSNWTITQDANGNCNITCTSIGSGGKTPYFVNINMPLAQGTFLHGVPTVFAIELQSPNGATIYNENIPLPADGSLPSVQVSGSSITTSGSYSVLIKTRFMRPGYVSTDAMPNMNQYKYQVFPSVLTAPVVTTTSTASLYSWLTSDYYYLTDLQVNLETRAVTHRHGTVTLRPGDTTNFAILFNNGTNGVDPVASDIKLAVRGSSNNGPYALWSAATVTTAAVSGDTYYSITMTALDEDLLSIQAENILSGTASESLIGEIQWTTSRGTFSSDTFTINVPTEVVREADV
jgi:hypothetical protein